MFLLLCGMCVWGLQQHTLIHVDHKTLRCSWRLVNHNKWCNGIKRLGCVNGFSTHMAAETVRIIQFWCQQRKTLLYHISIVARIVLNVHIPAKTFQKQKLHFFFIIKHSSSHVHLFYDKSVDIRCKHCRFCARPLDGATGNVVFL